MSNLFTLEVLRTIQNCLNNRFDFVSSWKDSETKTLNAKKLVDALTAVDLAIREVLNNG